MVAETVGSQETSTDYMGLANTIISSVMYLLSTVSLVA